MTLTKQYGRVLADGGARDGVLIFANDELAAVFVELISEDVDGVAVPGKWYLEAGFGPCGSLETLTPEPFSTLRLATDWVDRCLPVRKT